MSFTIISFGDYNSNILSYNNSYSSSLKASIVYTLSLLNISLKFITSLVNLVYFDIVDLSNTLNYNSIKVKINKSFKPNKRAYIEEFLL